MIQALWCLCIAGLMASCMGMVVNDIPPHRMAFVLGDAEPEQRTVELEWNSGVPIVPGYYTNVTLTGFETYKLVWVFISDSEDLDNYYKLDVSGVIGHLQFKFPEQFPRWSILQVAAIGIPSWDEDHVGGYIDAALDPDYYLVDDLPREVDFGVNPVPPYGNHHYQRDVAAVWINGNPKIIRKSQLITLVWTGFSSVANISVGIVCPRGSQSTTCVPVSQNYNTIPVAYSFPVPQVGCQAFAIQAHIDNTSGACVEDAGTIVYSSQKYMIMN